ncbi:MAG: hypothetical protein M3285_12080 [Actinomycetota bacterium]|nr:hypothetical protein [Actinomycetota bacterium]
MRRLLLMTIDEARAALVSSSLKVIRLVNCDLARTCRLLQGTGRTTGFSQGQRRAVSEHRLLVQSLQTDGLGTVVDEEIEGLTSLLEREWSESSQRKAG